MTADLLLSIDVGTQSVRALVFDRDGTMRARAGVPFEPPFDSPHPGWAEKEVVSYWRGLVESCQALWKQGIVAPSRIAGLALTTTRTASARARTDALRGDRLAGQRRRPRRAHGGSWKRFRARRAGELSPLQRQASALVAQQEPELWPDCER